MTLDSTSTLILGLGTAVPRFRASQDTLTGFALRVIEASVDPPRRQRTIDLARKVYAGSRVGTRCSVIPDFAADDPSSFEFFPPNWQLDPFPTTAERMKVYEDVSVDLASEAAERALGDAGLSAEQVTHLVVSSCTGFFAPGPDVLLCQRLGMRSDVERSLIGFMGCYSGFNGMRSADHIVRAGPDAVVLQICVELCSLHYQKRPEADLIVANSLFADGCAAAVYGSSQRYGQGRARVLKSRSFLEEGSLSQMSWRIGNHGFEMRLATQVPMTLHSRAPDFVDNLLRSAGLGRDEVTKWAVHPGGPKILEALGDALELGAGSLDDSFAVLRDFGNMSSGTVFFVLERQLAGQAMSGPTVVLGFGPGLSVEGAVLV